MRELETPMKILKDEETAPLLVANSSLVSTARSLRHGHGHTERITMMASQTLRRGFDALQMPSIWDAELSCLICVSLLCLSEDAL